MKKLLIGYLLLMIVFLASCSDEVLIYQDANKQCFDETIEISKNTEMNFSKCDNITDLEKQSTDESIDSILINFDFYKNLLEDEQSKVNELLTKIISKKTIVFYGSFQYKQIVNHIKSIDNGLYLQMDKICSDDNKMIKAIAFDNISNHYTFLRYFSDNNDAFNDDEANILLSAIENFRSEYEFNNYAEFYSSEDIFGKVLDVYNYKDFYLTVYNDLFHVENNQKWGLYTEAKIISKKDDINGFKISHNTINDNSDEQLISFYPVPSNASGNTSGNEFKAISDTIPYMYYSSYPGTSISTGDVDENSNSIYWYFDNENNSQESATFNTVSIWYKDDYSFSCQLKYDLYISGDQYEFVDNIEFT